MKSEKFISIINSFKEQRKSRIISSCEYFNFVFLCGGERYVNDNRTLIQKLLEKNRDDVRVLYSEELHKIIDHFDLLTFEEILADFSSNIIIIIESYGSACELGAFSYYPETLKKLIVLNDRRFKDSQSFISNGPIRKVQNISENRVIYCEFIENKVENNVKTIITDTKLLKNLDEVILRRRTFKESDLILYSEEKLLKIGNLYVFQLLIIEIVRMFICVHKISFIKYIFDVYEIENIIVSVEPNINLNFKDVHEKKLVQNMIELIIKLLSDVGVFSINDDFVTLKSSQFDNETISINKLNSVLIKSSYLNSRQYLKSKSKLINIYKKEGRDLWNL